MERTGKNRSNALANEKTGLYICKLDTPEYEEFRKEEGIYHVIPDNPEFIAIEPVGWMEG
jgi:hypothetical protein